jgi:hypothetical protein
MISMRWSGLSFFGCHHHMLAGWLFTVGKWNPSLPLPNPTSHLNRNLHSPQSRINHAQFSTAAAWESRGEKIKEMQAALTGAAPRAGTPPVAPSGAAEASAAPGGGEEEGAEGGEDPEMTDFGAGMPTGSEPQQGGTAGADGDEPPPAAAARPSGGSGGGAGGAPAAAATPKPAGPATRIGGAGGGTPAAAIDWASIRSEALERQAVEAAAAAAAKEAAGEEDLGDEPVDGEDPYDPAEGYDLGDLGGAADEEAGCAESEEEDVEDLGPIVGGRPRDSPGARPPGAAVWAGRFATAGVGAFSAVVAYLGGLGPLDRMLGAQVRVEMGTEGGGNGDLLLM